MKMQNFWSRFSQESRFKVRGDEFARFAGSSGLLVVWALALLLDARTILRVTRRRAFSGAGGAGRSETESEGSLHDLPNSLVAVGAANALGDVDIAGACGEHDLDGHVVEFGNLQLAAFAEFGYLHCLDSTNSFICHPCMRLLLHVSLMGCVKRFFFDCGRAVRCMLSLECGRFLHLVVLYGYQGADREAEKLALTDQLLDAASGEPGVVFS